MIYFVFQLLKIRIRCRCHLLPSSLIDEDDKGGGEDDERGHEAEASRGNGMKVAQKKEADGRGSNEGRREGGHHER